MCDYFIRIEWSCPFGNPINIVLHVKTQIARFMGPTWGPPGSCRPQIGSIPKYILVDMNVSENVWRLIDTFFYNIPFEVVWQVIPWELMDFVCIHLTWLYILTTEKYLDEYVSA